MKMDNDDLLDLLRRKESAASAFTHGALSVEREDAVSAYHRMPYGNEVDGWSTVITSDVQDTVEWILPALLKTFTATDKAVSFEPTTAKDVEGAEQATDTCNYVFYKQNNGFLVLYTAIKDALMVKNCAVTWRKETNEVVSNVPFKDASPEMLAMLTEDGSEILEANETPIIDPQTGQPAIDMMGNPVMGFSGRLKKIEEKTIVKVEAFNPDDLLIEDGWTSPLLADCPYVGRLMPVTLSDLKLMGYKDVTAEDLRGSQGRGLATDTSRVDRVDANIVFTDRDQSDDDSQATGYLRIEYVLADVDGDGIAERLCVYRLDSKILKQEVVTHVPFATFSPVLNPHRWDGLSVADLVMDLQKLHTEMLRQTFDNLKLTSNPRTKVLTDSNWSPLANIDDLLDSRPGGIIRQRQFDAVTEQVTPFAAGAAMPMFEYIQGMRENRTGVSRTSQGLNPDSLNNTATGRALDVSSAMQRIELIARIIAEVLVKPMFCGILKLLTEGGMEKLAFRLRDEFVEYDPNGWRDQYDMTVNVGLGTGDSNQKMQALQMIMQNQMALMSMGLADPQKIYHTQSKMVEAAGFKDVQNFLTDPRGKPPTPPPPNPMLQVEQMKQQGTAAANQFKAQQDMQTLQMTTQLQDQQHQREMQRDMEVERNKQEMQARDSQFQAQLEAQKEQQRMQMEEASKEADRMLQKYIADLNARVKLEIAGIKSPETLEGEEVEKVEKEDKFLQAMQMMLQTMNQPKMVVRDNMGKAIGIQSVGATNGT